MKKLYSTRLFANGRILASAGFLSAFFLLPIINCSAQFAKYEWAKKVGGTSTDWGYGTTVDKSGNVYIAGTFNGTADFDPGAGTANLISAGSADICFAKYDSNGNYIWAKSIGGTGADIGNSIAVDTLGNVYVAGYFDETADFNAGAGTDNHTAIGLIDDIFFLKYDSNGNYVWAKTIGSTINEAGNSIALDDSGNVVITGFFGSTVDFDPGAGTANLTSAGGGDFFIAKYNTGGSYLWANRIGTATGNDWGYDITVDTSGNIYVTGKFKGTVADFDPGAGTANLTPVGGYDIFFAKYNRNGNYIWAKNIGSIGDDESYSITVDASGNTYITGHFYGTTDFDPGAGTAILNLIVWGDAFLAKYDSSGNYLWAKSIGSTTANTYGNSVIVDTSDNVYITGYFGGSVDFDPGAGSDNLTPVGGDDIFFAKYDSSGNYRWAKSIGGTNTDKGNSIAVDISGNVYVSGYFNLTADFDAGAGTANLTASGGDIFFLKYGFCNLSASLSSTGETCLGNIDGTATVVAGGVSPYAYSWNTSPIQTTATATGLMFGSYTITVTDAVGCNRKDSYVVPLLRGAWSPKADFGGVARYGAVGFSIGGKGYIGTGLDGTISRKDFWEYDTTSNAWTQKADFGGTARYFAVGFSIGTKGYIGTGTGGGSQQDFWEWDQASNNWTQKTNFGGTARYSAVGFSIAGKGYIGTGYDGAFVRDFWEYDTTTNAWTQKVDFGGTARMNAVGFSIGTKGYIGTGYSSTAPNYKQDFWEYDPTGNAWLQKTNFGGIGRHSAAGFSIGTKGYIGTGLNGSTYYKDFWQYDQTTDIWLRRTDFPAPVRYSATAFSIGNYGYMGTGYHSASSTYYKDFFKYDPTQDLEMNITATNLTCNGSGDGSISITASGGPLPYLYSDNGGSSYQSPNTFSNLPISTYTVVVKDNWGCKISSPVTITQPAVLTYSFSSSNVTSCISGFNGSITVNASGGTTPYQYSDDGGSIFQSPNIFSNLAPGTYSVTVKDTNNCTSPTTTVTITRPIAAIAFSANPITGNIPLVVTFTNSTTNQAQYTYNWNWGDGNSLSSNNVTVFHTYSTPGLFDVTLTATNIATGCIDSLKKIQYINATGTGGCTHSATVSPAGPVNACNGDTVILQSGTNAAPPFTLQWNLNSSVITGSTNDTLVVTQTGFYSITVTDFNGCSVTSADAQITFFTNPTQPTISSSGVIDPCTGSSVTLTASTIPGVTYSWNTGATTQSITVNIAGNYWVTVTNANNCTTVSSVYPVSSSSIPAPPICLVTVDTSTNTQNVVAWEKPVPQGAIDSFRIYREIGLNNYVHIGSVLYDSLSWFTDTTNGVNPKVQSYRYKISVIDSCAGESALSAFHRTIHLSTPQFTPPNTFDLIWTNDYEGFPFSQYYILRDGNNTGNWIVRDSVTFGNLSYTDLTAPTDSARYIVEATPALPCNVSLKNPDVFASTIKSSKSNTSDKTQNPVSVNENILNQSISVYPNPNHGTFTLETKSPCIIKIYNTLGELVYQSSATGKKTEIKIPTSVKGIYQLQLINNSEISDQKIIIE